MQKNYSTFIPPLNMRPQNLLKICLLLICVQSALSRVNVSVAENGGEKVFRQIYVDMDKGLKSIVRQILKSALRAFNEARQELNISANCMRNNFRLLSGLRDLDLWAVSFIDASGKPGDGLMSGNSQMLGNYDQCLNSTGLKKNGDVDFRGKYCFISYKPYLPKPNMINRFQDRVALIEKLTQNLTDIIRLFVLKSELTKGQKDGYGLCIPSGCDKMDVAQMLKLVEEKTLLNLTTHYCHTEEDLTTLTPLRIGIICFFAVFALLAIIGSLLEYYFKLYNIRNENSAMKILVCFSLKSNFRKFIKTEASDSNISCLYGIRVLTLFFIILGHHYMTGILINATQNTMTVYRSLQQFFFQIILNGFLCVDVFFFIGGFLNCYTRMNMKAASTSFRNSLMLLVHRLFRIIPTYVACILFSLLLIPRGPMSFIAYRILDGCTTEWWRNILFIENFKLGKKKCLPHAWYLSDDMQYFVVSLITISLLKRRPKTGAALNLIIVIVSIAFTVFMVWKEKLPPTFVFTNAIKLDLAKVYFASSLPFPHAATYFAGVFLGNILASKRDIKLSKITQILGWTIASSTFLFLLFITKRWNSGIRYTALESVLYFTFSRPLYGMCIGWLIFCCFTGHGGFINYILSLKLWIPFYRLSLSAYLVSFPLQLFYMGNTRTTVDMKRMPLIWAYFGDLAATCLIALCVTLLFESPFLALEKIIFSKRLNAESNADTVKVNELKSIENQNKVPNCSRL